MDVGKAKPRALPRALPSTLVPVVLTAAGLGVGFVAGVGVGGWQNRDEKAAGGVASPASASSETASGSPNGALATSLAAQARLLKFVPVHQPIPHCADFTGTGTIPAGDTLLIFDRAADARGKAVAGSAYDFDGRAAPDSADTWEAKERWIGPAGGEVDTGRYAQMSAVLVPTGVADFLDSVPGAYRTGWQETVLRLGSVADTMLVEKGSDTHPCPR